MSWRLSIAAAALLAIGSAALPPALPDVTLYLPRFAAPGAIGANVTATVNLSIWRTLRKKPWPNPTNLDFGSGLVIWSDDQLPENPARAARATLRDNADLDMILWGSAQPVGPDVVVQAYLLTRPLEDGAAPRQALWQVSRGGRTLSLGLPRQLYVMGSVPLRRDLVALFDAPSALRVCPTKTRHCAGPAVGPTMRALEHQGPWTSLITPDGRRGWVYLHEIGATSNEIASFTGGLISYYRGDYGQAARLFEAVSTARSANALVQEDAATLRAAALSRAGAPGAAAAIDAVRSVDPYSVFALQTAVMDALARPEAGVERRRTLGAELRRAAGLFDATDPWPRQAAAMLNAG
ncbi:hypothetical protein U1701_07665 [Sphingomonas sp. PB2P19]|uniref:hypothetical protein n=1 Tax=Sphingomonas rhamnosi TaxID=3096156 RepID=UPI002FCC3E20